MRIRPLPFTSLSLSILLFLQWAMPAQAREISPIELQTFTSHSRLLFRVSEDVQVKVTNTPEGFELYFAGITLVDFGAPLGVEQEWARQWEKVADTRFDQLRIEETPSGVKVFGKWKYPKGDQAPAEPGMEHFDYRARKPVPRFVLDFWQKKGPTVAEARKAERRDRKISELNQSRAEADARRNRRLASMKVVQEVEDLDQFCRQPLTDESDVFLHFTPFHQVPEWEKYFPTNTPDFAYTYRKPEVSPAKENSTGASDEEYVSLALKLYGQGNFALTLKTIEFFESEHSKSPYQGEMEFLKGNALLKLGHKDHAESIFKEIKLNYPDAPFTFHTVLYLIHQQIQSHAYLNALEGFFWLIDRYESHSMAWLFHLGAAEMHFKLRETPQAQKEYGWVAEHAPDAEARAQGALRIGDLYLDRRQYAQGLAAYFNALSTFKKEAEKFPSVHLNRAESLYWLGRYEDAAKGFKEFLRMFPSHPQGWRAAFRLGEIEARKTPRAQAEKARKWYTDTINRYPHSAGATLARIRLADCPDQSSLPIEAFKRIFLEDSGLDGKGDETAQVNLDRYQDFKNLAYLRGLISFGQYEPAVFAAIRGLQQGPSPKVRLVMEEHLEKLFRKVIVDLMDQGKSERAIAFYQENYSSIPKAPDGPTSRAPDHLLRLAQTATDLGLAALAGQITRDHEEVLKRRKGGRAIAAEDLDQKLKEAETAFTSARALWGTQGQSASERIAKLLEDVIPESPFSYGKEVILGLIAKGSGNVQDALAHAIRAQLLVPRDDEREKLIIAHWVTRLQAKVGETDPAIRSYGELYKRARSLKSEERKSGKESLAVSLGIPSLPPVESLMIAQVELLEEKGRWKEAAQAYGEVVRAGLGGNQARYEYARLLRKTGLLSDAKEARKTLEELAKSEEDDFWIRLAREALANEQITSAREGI